MFESSIIPEPGTQLVQNGWRVSSRDGVELGFVIDATDDELIIRNGGEHADLRIPKRYLAEVAEGQLQASLVLDETEARLLYDVTPSVEA